jgi:hypothetical protein
MINVISPVSASDTVCVSLKHESIASEDTLKKRTEMLAVDAAASYEIEVQGYLDKD